MARQQRAAEAQETAEEAAQGLSRKIQADQSTQLTKKVVATAAVAVALTTERTKSGSTSLTGLQCGGGATGAREKGAEGGGGSQRQ